MSGNSKEPLHIQEIESLPDARAVLSGSELSPSDYEVIEIIESLPQPIHFAEPIGDPYFPCLPFYTCCKCFAKRVILHEDRVIYTRICSYVYTTDGLKYMGRYDYSNHSITITNDICENPDIRYCNLCVVALLCLEFIMSYL